MGRQVFIFLFFFVNRFLCFVQFFAIIIIKCKASFYVIHPHLIIQHKVSFSSCFISFFLF